VSSHPRQRSFDGIGKDVLVMVGLIVVAMGGVAWFSLWDAGYLGSYWERWERGGDIKCFDVHGRATTSSQQTCFVLTQRGLHARERLTEECKGKGQDEDQCRELATGLMASDLTTRSH
jgi:hypothetical protein